MSWAEAEVRTRVVFMGNQGRCTCARGMKCAGLEDDVGARER